MKLVRFGERENERPGLIDSDGVMHDLSGVVADIDGPTLASGALSNIDATSLPVVTGSPRLGPCVGAVGKFLCIGLNYSDHAAESKMAVPTEPEVFSKAVTAITGPNDDIIKPRDSEKLDWEVELAVIIGQEASYVSRDRALEYIAGYCICNDVSERKFQLEQGSQWDKGKGCDSFGPIGPWLVTPDEIDDLLNLKLWLDVNGTRFQEGTTSTMIFDPVFIVSYVSQYMTLLPGDVISTGTPPGVGLGQKPPVYLHSGDVIELGIEGLGTQRQVVVDPWQTV